jgi:small multidrug resistance pump
MNTSTAYFYLALAILSEVVGTSLLKSTQQFTRLIPSALVILSYLASFYFLTISLKVIQIGMAYAIWSGVGIILISIAGIIFYHQLPDIPGIIGMGLIILGVIVIYLFSATASIH